MKLKKLLNMYGWHGAITLIVNKLVTKVYFSPARLIQLPIDIRNRKDIQFGKNFVCGKYCRIEAFKTPGAQDPCIQIGENVQFNDFVHIVGSVGISIGNNVLLASKIFISDLNHGSYGMNGLHDSPLIPPAERAISSRAVCIEDNVWIGELVSILPGVVIGKGSTIGSGSVVTKSIPEYSIAVGNPAKVIKKYNFGNKKWENF